MTSNLELLIEKRLNKPREKNVPLRELREMVSEILGKKLNPIIEIKKGKDSIMFGIQLIQDQEYLITSNSLNLIKELRGYVWDTDKTGKRLNKPRGINDHLIDALRYHEQENLSNKNYGQYFIK